MWPHEYCFFKSFLPGGGFKNASKEDMQTAASFFRCGRLYLASPLRLSSALTKLSFVRALIGRGSKTLAEHQEGGLPVGVEDIRGGVVAFAQVDAQADEHGVGIGGVVVITQTGGQIDADVVDLT